MTVSASAVRSALVTGGTVRLGKAIADRLRADGWRVLVTSHRPDAGADIVADFATPSGAVNAYAAAMRLLNGKPPDALVNNAALFSDEEPELRAVNLTAPVKLTMLMAGRETPTRGAVVNILDARVLGDRPADGAYAQTKRALLDETKKAAALFAESLRVNAVAPGPVFAPTAVHEKAGETLLGRPTAADVAAAVAYLLDATSTTGVVLPVDGGQHLLLAAES